MSGFSIGDEVRLVMPLAGYEWTEKLLGEEGRVVEVRGNSQAPLKRVKVEGLMAGEPLWFRAACLELVEEESGAA